MTNDIRPTLIDGDLRLRPPQNGDLAARLALGNHPEIHKMSGGAPGQFGPITQEQAKAA